MSKISLISPLEAVEEEPLDVPDEVVQVQDVVEEVDDLVPAVVMVVGPSICNYENLKFRNF